MNTWLCMFTHLGNFFDNTKFSLQWNCRDLVVRKVLICLKCLKMTYFWQILNINLNIIYIYLYLYLKNFEKYSKNKHNISCHLRGQVWLLIAHNLDLLFSWFPLVRWSLPSHYSNMFPIFLKNHYNLLACKKHYATTNKVFDDHDSVPP